MSFKVDREARRPTRSSAWSSRVDGRPQVIEYSDLPPELAGRREPEGRLELWAGSIAIHVLERAFIERLVGEHQLPFHRAIKKVPYVDERGETVKPAEPNAVKFEQFIFDALPAGRAVGDRRDRPRQRVRAAQERDRARLAGDRPPADERPVRRLARTGRRRRSPAGPTARSRSASRSARSIALDAHELKAKLEPGLVIEKPIYLREPRMQSPLDKSNPALSAGVKDTQTALG